MYQSIKKILLPVFLIVSVTAFSQEVKNDTLFLKVGKLNIQARDAESLRSYFSRSDIFDDLIDSLNVDYRKQGTKPQGSDVLTVDSLSIIAMLTIMVDMRYMPYAESFTYFSRVDAAIRAMTSTKPLVTAFFNKQLADIDAAVSAAINNNRNTGRKRYLGKN